MVIVLGMVMTMPAFAEPMLCEVALDTRALGAEFVGTFSLVGAICGAGLFVAPAGGGLLAIALAAGLSLLAMTQALGHISGGHFNPAVTLGLVAGGRFDMGTGVAYIIAQVLGGLLAALIVASILAGAPAGTGAVRWNDFAAISNTYGSGKFQMGSAFLMEVVVTALYLVVFMGATSKKAPAGFAPIAIGLGVAALYLVALPVSAAALNPARATATAVIAGGQALGQLWVFWVAPIIGGIIGGILSRWLQEE